MTLTQVALFKALSQNGVQEVPRNSNTGPAVEKYLKSVGLSKGYAWCMAFVYWSFKEAATELKIANPLFKTGGVLAMWNASKAFRLTLPLCPVFGDVFIMDFGNGTGHAGFVIMILPKGCLLTIEGNTNDAGSREGYEVCVRSDRKISDMKGFLRFK